MKVSALLILAGAFIAVPAATGSVSTATPAKTIYAVVHPSSSVPLRGGYGRLVADGTRVAAAGCRIALWKAGARRPSFVEACRAARRIDNWGLDELALAGDRLAWMREESISHGMRIQTELVVKQGAARPREIASAYDDSGFGAELISLAGEGSTLAFGWTYSFDEDFEDHLYRISRTSGAGPCPFEDGGLLPNPPQTTFCADTGVPGGFVNGVSDGRILISFGGFGVSVVEPDNSVVDLPIPDSQKHLELGISGTDVVAVQAGTSELDVYDAVTGAPRQTWPIAKVGAVRRLSIGGGFALFNFKGTHLVDLGDGSERTVLAPGKKPPIASVLTKKGLFLLYRVNHRARLGFVPAPHLQAAIKAG